MTLLNDLEETKKEKKKKKKLRLAEERAWLEARASLTSPPPLPRAERRVDPTALQEWLHALSNDRLVAATKSSVMIAANGVMLAIAAHALYGALAFGPIVPLALTNLLSLVFSIASARAVREGDFEQPPEPLQQSREELFSALSHELHLRADALAKSRARLRTAYTVLLGGVVLATLTFVLSAVLERG